MDRCRRIVAAICVTFLPPGVAAAAPETFGTATEIVHVVAAADFAALHSVDTWDHAIVLDATTGAIIRGASNPVTWLAGLRLAAGAVVTRLELAGCDFSNTTAIEFMLFRSRIPAGTGADQVTPTGSTGAGGTPGCGRFSVTPVGPPLVIDNVNNTYWINVATSNVLTTFDSVRVYYQLQVSPAPATATFSDVPASHPFFQFVEALVASGITAGCGGGNYCPEAPLTRGQMAVFLGKALGLHFAP